MDSVCRRRGVGEVDMVDPGSFFVGLAVGIIAGIVTLTGVGWVRIRRRGWTSDEELARRELGLRKATELEAENDRLVRLWTRAVAHSAYQKIELAKLNRAIRKRNRTVTNLRIGGGSQPERTPGNDAAGPRAGSPSPRVGGGNHNPRV